MATETKNGSPKSACRPTWRGGFSWLGLVGFVMLSGVLPAWGGDWKLTDSVTASATVVDRSGQNSESGVVLQVSPRINMTGRGARANADVSYQFTTSLGIGDTDPQAGSHHLLASGEVEAVENFFFVAGEAAARLVGNDANSGPVDAINLNSDGSQSYSLRIKPEVRHHFGTFADFLSLNSADYVTYSGNGGGNNDDSYMTTLNATLRSGRDFGLLSWQLDATRNTTDFDDRTDTRTEYSVGLGYQLSPRWSVNGRVGYEKNDILTSRSDTDGVVWDVGADWAPNPRTTLSVRYGDRYVGNVFSGSFTHRSRRTVLSLDASRNVANRRDFQLIDAFFFVLDQNGDRIIDPGTGNPLIVNIPQLRETDEDFLNTQLRAAVTVTGRRTSVTVTGMVANRQYEVTADEEDSYNLAASVSRQLGSDLSAVLTGGLRRTEGANASDSDTYDIQLSLSRSISRRTSASLNVLHREHDVSNGSGDYTENRIGVSVTTSFL